MDIELLKKKLMYGCFLGMAIASRFLLGFQEGVLSEVTSFILLFSMFSAVVYWLRQLRQKQPDQKYNLKKLVAHTFQIFIVAAVFSSIVKYLFFTYIKPFEFKIMVEQTVDFMSSESDYPEEIISQSKELLTPAIISMFSGILNALLGLLMGLIVWPLFKKEQEFFSKK